MATFKKCITPLFLALELILYYLILTTGGDVLVWSSYIAIVLCFLYALVAGNDALMKAGLFFTVCADFCLVICSPIQQLWGMLLFTVTQTLYALRLQKIRPNRFLLAIRIVLTVIAALVALLVLKEKVDALAIVSICYYANLIMNIAEAFTQFRANRLFPIALVLFILCDTVIGLKVACGTYLRIGEDSVLYHIIFCGLNISWFFYLPSQVLIALSSKHNP